MELIIFVAAELYERDMITIGEISTFYFYLTIIIFLTLMLARVLGTSMMILGATH